MEGPPPERRAFGGSSVKLLGISDYLVAGARLSSRR